MANAWATLPLDESVSRQAWAYAAMTGSCQLATDLGGQQLIEHFGRRKFQIDVVPLDLHWERADVIFLLLQRLTRDQGKRFFVQRTGDLGNTASVADDPA